MSHNRVFYTLNYTTQTSLLATSSDGNEKALAFRAVARKKKVLSEAMSMKTV